MIARSFVNQLGMKNAKPQSRFEGSAILNDKYISLTNRTCTNCSNRCNLRELYLPLHDKHELEVRRQKDHFLVLANRLHDSVRHVFGIKCLHPSE